MYWLSGLVKIQIVPIWSSHIELIQQKAVPSGIACAWALKLKEVSNHWQTITE